MRRNCGSIREEQALHCYWHRVNLVHQAEFPTSETHRLDVDPEGGGGVEMRVCAEGVGESFDHSLQEWCLMC